MGRIRRTSTKPSYEVRIKEVEQRASLATGKRAESLNKLAENMKRFVGAVASDDIREKKREILDLRYDLEGVREDISCTKRDIYDLRLEIMDLEDDLAGEEDPENKKAIIEEIAEKQEKIDKEEKELSELFEDADYYLENIADVEEEIKEERE